LPDSEPSAFCGVVSHFCGVAPRQKSVFIRVVRG
jgi:hypothetical protein